MNIKETVAAGTDSRRTATVGVESDNVTLIEHACL